jgi:peptidoglycan/xylan/chitin deacetylase (PgdA/CDA1 family)
MMESRLNSVLLIVGAFFLFYTFSVFSMEVAITVDDIPVNGQLPQHLSRADVSKKMLEIFKKHHIDGVYGLINGGKVNETNDGLAILESWVKNGQLLGNHTFNHVDLVKTNSDEYIADINKNESILKKLMLDKDYHYFRYPYLSEGNTQEKRDSVRQFLFKNGYQIVPVTVDFFEYEWNDPYVRCLNKADKKSLDWLKKTYIEQAENALIISHTLSMMLFNRDIKNILIIHMNAMTVSMLDELLTNYERKGVVFVSLQDVLTDEIYKINPNIVRDRAYTFLNQLRLSRNLENPEIVTKLYETLPEDKLSKLCT